MNLEEITQNFANSTGLIFDRTSESQTALGQAALVSKSRAIACASSVFNYVGTPWALAINFPHPNLALAAKAINLHPDFDINQANTRYLTQTGLPNERYPAQLNDLAIVVLEPQLSELMPDQVAQLQRTLALPFPTSGVEASGVVKGEDLLSLINSMLAEGKTGSLTFYDRRNVVVAGLELEQNSIKRVHFDGLINEMAFSELIFRKRDFNFVLFKPNMFNWGDIQPMPTATSNLIAEVSRRINELPQLIAKIGGVNARYQKTASTAAPKSANANMQWLIDRLWTVLNGYITLDKLAQRVYADTYSVVLGLKDLINSGAISLLNRATPFACGGQLGGPIVSHTDLEIKPGDLLSAFYLDPLSGAPVWSSGNFSGSASVLQPKNLLHTIPLPYRTPGALILKDYKLVGIHNGPAATQPGASPADGKLSQMIWISALLEISTRKMRDGDSTGSGSETGIAALRSRSDIQVLDTSSVKQKPPEQYICVSCQSPNTNLGPCFNCGAIIEAPEPEPEPQGLMKPVKKIEDLKKHYGVTNKQLIFGIAVICVIIILGMVFFTPQIPTTTSNVPQNTPAVRHSSEAAVELAVKTAGFKALAPPSYWYEDTFPITKPAKSFGLYSQTGNQKILFVLFDDLSPTLNLQSFIGRPLFANAKGPAVGEGIETKIDEGSQILGNGKINWYVGRYITDNDPAHPILVGAFAAKAEGKSYLVIGQTFEDTGQYDYKSTLWLIDQMAEEFTAEGNEKRLGTTSTPVAEKPKTTTSSDDEDEGEASTSKKNAGGAVVYATDEEINDFCAKLQTKLQGKLSLSEEAKDELKKENTKKLKLKLNLVIDQDGNVKKIDLTQPAEMESVNNAMVKDINSQAPFADVPKTKEGTLTVGIRFKKGQINVEPAL